MGTVGVLYAQYDMRAKPSALEELRTFEIGAGLSVLCTR